MAASGIKAASSFVFNPAEPIFEEGAFALCGVFHPAWRQAARIAALTLIINQVVAACFHFYFAGTGALPQNIVLALLALSVALLAPSANTTDPEATA